MKFTIATILLSLALAGTASADAVDAALDRSNQLIGLGEYAQAIKLLQPYADLARPDIDYALAYAQMSSRLHGRTPAELATADLEPVLFHAGRAAAKGDGSALNLLYMLYGNGWGVPVDGARALDYLRRAVEAGNAGAKINYAIMLYRGAPGVERQRDQACKLFVDLADVNGAASVAAYYLGLATLRGQCGLQVDQAKGVDLIRRAAEAGIRDAERDYGRALQSGFGVKADQSAALDWFEKAAGHGDGEAYWHLGMAHVEGNGRERDTAKAVDYFRKGVDAGSGSALVSLAVMYASGDGVEQDFAQALALYHRAAEAGEHHAYRNLAVMHLRGEGIASDPVQAWLNYSKGVELGNAPDPKLLAAIEANLDTTQREQARTTLEQWQQGRAARP